MAPDIAKIDTEDHPDLRLHAPNYGDEVLLRVLHGKTVFPSQRTAHPI